ncbi:HAD family hydrolase [Lacticaseibacillus baoqingensis]|uniref:HAD family hydrolase n=1 Tax=Lacticaseibacillus baoqingensis TaxID=2486013 RepID=A0ABW4E7K4_9LACO|nr:HAD-IA family hydrolase [Lacticaseibacillus baoqingensis]
MSTYIFDVDGTLIDSVPMYLHGLQDALHARGRDFALSDLTFSNGIPSSDTATQLGYFGSEAKALIAEWLACTKPYAQSVDWIPGMTKTMRQLRQAGHRLGIVTSKAAAEYALDDARFHFSDYVDTAVVAHDTKRNKPFGDPILLALKRLNGSREHAVYVGDTITDSQAAADAQVPFALATWTTAPSGALAPIAYALKTPEALLSL